MRNDLNKGASNDKQNTRKIHRHSLGRAFRDIKANGGEITLYHIFCKILGYFALRAWRWSWQKLRRAALQRKTDRYPEFASVLKDIVSKPIYTH